MARYSDSGYSGISMGTPLISMKSNTYLEISWTSVHFHKPKISTGSGQIWFKIGRADLKGRLGEREGGVGAACPCALVAARVLHRPLWHVASRGPWGQRRRRHPEVHGGEARAPRRTWGGGTGSEEGPRAAARASRRSPGAAAGVEVSGGCGADVQEVSRAAARSSRRSRRHSAGFGEGTRRQRACELRGARRCDRCSFELRGLGRRRRFEWVGLARV